MPELVQEDYDVNFMLGLCWSLLHMEAQIGLKPTLSGI